VTGITAIAVIGHASSTALAVKLGGNGVRDVGKLLKLLVKVLSDCGSRVLLEPVLRHLDGLEKSLLVLILDLATETFLVVDLVFEAVGVVLELVAGLNALTSSLVLIGILLGFLDHALNFFLSKTALVVGNGDALRFAGALVNGGDLQDTVGVKLKSDLDLGNTAGRGGDVGELKLSKVVAALN
jgi:hypothetical protein